MLVDTIDILIKAGNGGRGSVHFRRDGQTAKGGPDGGNGGRGGSIYFQGSHNITDLTEFRYKKKIIAQDGVSGLGSNLYGKNAPDIVVLVPLGTQISEVESKKVHEILDTKSRALLVAGGKGGKGNVWFKSATSQTPLYAQPGIPGEQKRLHLELRLIAHIGLIGLPNAGKSSLLSVLTAAAPRIADYPFTTLEPNIGMFGTHPIADIPGLIEGASTGKGLGIKFLKHIEKTQLLLHCIDINSQNPMQDYETVRKEFAQYSAQLLEKPEIILLTKTDLVDEEKLKVVSSLFKKLKKTVLSMSIIDDEKIAKLKKVLQKELKNS